MKVSEFLSRLAKLKSREDYRIQRHIMEDEDCIAARDEIMGGRGVHEAGHIMGDFDDVVMLIHEYGMPEDLEEILENYKLNGARNKDRGAATRPMTTVDFDKLWGNDDEGV